MDRWKQVSEVFQAVISREPDERQTYLEQVCGDDKTLLGEVRELISAFQKAEHSVFIGGHAAEFAAPMFAKERDLTGQTIASYQVIRRIGSGGMGEVYLAHDARLHRMIGLKVLLPEIAGDTARVRRFEQEARAASALNHPNILTIHDIGTVGETHYIATEYIDGETLRRRLDDGALQLKQAVDIALQVAAALAAAHRSNIIHRDIKPENIMVRSDGLVKVLDFGLAKLTGGLSAAPDDQTIDQVRTASGVIMGTVSYMSPEQARGRPVDARTDIWSLGVVLYEMIAGQTPFAAETITDALVAIVDKEPPSLRELAPQTPAELDRIVRKTLCKDTSERYRSADELIADLQEFRRELESAEISGRSVPGTLARDKSNGTNGKQGPFGSVSRRFLILAALALLTASGLLVYFLRWYQAAPGGTEIRSLAVLPLKSLDTGENYLGLGIADAVIRRISQTGELIVRPTSSVRRYLNAETDALSAARELNADAVLEGSVQHAGDRVRVSINLLRTNDGRSLGTDQFDLQTTDALTMQDLVAQKVASRLRLQLDPTQQSRLGKRYTSNPIAYEYYLKALYSFDQRIRQRKNEALAMIDLFKKAIDADPDFALAHAQLGYAYALIGVFMEPTEPQWAALAREETTRAEALDPQLAEPHIARFALLFSQFEGYQTEAAVREVKIAQQLDPNVGHPELAYLYMHIGLEDLAQREIEKAVEIDPTSQFVAQLRLDQYYMAARYDAWLAAYEKAGVKDRSAEIWHFLAVRRLDDAEKMIDQLQRSLDDSSTPPVARIELPVHRALLSALRGDFRTAEAAIPDLLAMHPVKDPTYHHVAYYIGCIYALEGKSGEAVKWLRESAETGFQPFGAYGRDRYFDRIRGSSEFTRFVSDMQQQYENYRHEFADN